MPHIVLDQKIDLCKFYDVFEEIFLKTPIIKIQNIFMDKLERTALFPTVVVESKNSQQFLIEINVKDGRTTIRLYPNTDPEKTSGVKTSMGLLVNSILHVFPDVKIMKTNIQEFIGESK